MGLEGAETVQKGLEGAHRTFSEERVVLTDTRRTLSTAAKPRMPSQLVATVVKRGQDLCGMVDIVHILAPA